MTSAAPIPSRRHSFPATQPAFEDRLALADPVIAVAHDFPAGTRIDSHSHDRAQLLHAVSGTMRIETQGAVWIVPPTRAFWIAPGVEHAVVAVSALAVRSLYLRPDRVAALAMPAGAISVSPLLRELVLRLIEIYDCGAPKRSYEGICALAVEEIGHAEPLDLCLPMPADRRMARICQRLIEQPDERRTLAEWGREIGASARTLERICLAETGLTFRGWRQQALVLDALARLAGGASVAAVAYDLGYQNPSAFATMFRRAYGQPPSACRPGPGV